MESSTPYSLIGFLTELPLLDVHTDFCEGVGRVVTCHFHYHKQAYRYDTWNPTFQLSYSCVAMPGRRFDGYSDRVRIARDKAKKCPCLLDATATCPHPYYRSLKNILQTKFKRPHSLVQTYKLGWGSFF